MMKAPRIQTSFSIVGDALDPDQFTRLINIQPTRTGRKGDPVANPKARALGHTVPVTFWEFQDERDSYSLDEGIQVIMEHIWERRARVVNYLNTTPNVTAAVVSVVHYSHDPPAYEVSRDSIEKLAYLECKFGLGDIYKNYSEDESDF